MNHPAASSGVVVGRLALNIVKPNIIYHTCWASVRDLSTNLRPPWMAEVRKTQEQFFRCPPWMAEVRKTQEQFFRRPPWMAEVRNPQTHHPWRAALASIPSAKTQEQFFRHDTLRRERRGIEPGEQWH